MPQAHGGGSRSSSNAKHESTEAADHLTAIIAEAGVGIAEIAPDGRVLMVNDAFCSLAGRSRAALLKSSFEQFMFPDDVEQAKRALGRLAAEDERLTLPLRLRKADGTVLWVEYMLTRLTDARGHFSVLAVVVDVSARRESEERLHFALDAAEMGTWWWEPGQDVVIHDARALEILGIVPGTEMSFAAALEKHLQPENAQAYREGLQRVMDPTGSGRFQIEVSWLRPDGVQIWLQMTGQAHFDTEGNERRPTWLTGTMLDITERKRNEEAIEEASRQKDRFLATLAHELRNPLAPLAYAAELLQQDGNRQIDWSRGVIDRQLKHLTRLIDDLLDLSRITRDQLEVRRERIAIGDVVHAAVEASRPTLRRHAQDLDVGLPLQTILVHGDFVRLTQVFTNLLKNAAKFSAEPGHVWLTVEPRDDTVSICVRDSGIGIPPDELPRVFDMFYQSDLSTAHTHGGLGIGLYLVRRIVEMHEGTVEVRSRGERQGSEFIVRLPVMAHDETADSSAVAGRERPEVHKESRRVLIVDDNRDCADTLAKLMRTRGDEVETAYDGAMGLDAAERSHPDVVLLDLGMPKLDGYTVCRRIREQPWGKSVRLVAVSGWGRAEDLARTKSAGFDDHLVKPVSLAAIDALLRQGRSAE